LTDSKGKYKADGRNGKWKKLKAQSSKSKGIGRKAKGERHRAWQRSSKLEAESKCLKLELPKM
jgi:hypothetical protein